VGDMGIHEHQNPGYQAEKNRIQQPLPSLSVIVPVFNCQATIAELITRINDVCFQECSQFEVILVNDGSRDCSWAALCELEEQFEWVKCINLMRNYGQHNALLCGIRAAKYDYIITMDDDLQHPPEEIPHLLEKVIEGYDVVYGYPEKEQHGLWRDLASLVLKITLQNAMGTKVARNASAFRIFRTYLRDAFANYCNPYICLDVLLTWGTTKFSAIPVRHEPRKIGKSNYSLKKLINLAITMMTGFSTLPLQIASFMGFSLTLFGFGILIYVFGRLIIEGESVPGFPFLASIVAIFSGAQMFVLGIIGEYLARMHFRLMEKPTYIISKSGPGDAVQPLYQESSDFQVASSDAAVISHSL
jgi:glycosyltransferase involved in cell wall biosynthesis